MRAAAPIAALRTIGPVATKRRPTAAEARAAWEQLADREAIVTVADLQARWNLTQQRVQQLADLDSFPEPLSGRYGAVWLAADIDDWSRDYNERPGKPGPRSHALPTRELADVDADADRQAWETVKRSGGLATTADLAAKWGITERAARNRTKRDGFPPPAIAGRWLRAEIPTS